MQIFRVHGFSSLESLYNNYPTITEHCTELENSRVTRSFSTLTNGDRMREKCMCEGQIGREETRRKDGYVTEHRGNIDSYLLKYDPTPQKASISLKL